MLEHLKTVTLSDKIYICTPKDQSFRLTFVLKQICHFQRSITHHRNAAMSLCSKDISRCHTSASLKRGLYFHFGSSGLKIISQSRNIKYVLQQYFFKYLFFWIPAKALSQSRTCICRTWTNCSIKWQNLQWFSRPY